ncbi:cytochrome b [Pseudomonas gingeri]|uniref:cytochrome b n=1 Tax=Pseudomonas gingeri TaxID=117681 RepID=UPI0015A3AF04|nr:cytochrome b [Pseudomonas gingeri]NVZ60721.1 cytochrome b [Pseudomonas gingeri]NVZ75392.1 cytochrome b [Pseudomonas gingeri]
MKFESVKGYTKTAKWVHWGMAVIWIVAWCIGMVCVHLRDPFNPDHVLTGVHKSLASTILFLVVFRVVWRLAHPVPPLPGNMSSFMRRGARAGHLLLYALALGALPFSGWYMSSLGGKPVHVAWLFALPQLSVPDQNLYNVARGVHTYLAWLCGLLISGHILAAFYHHYVQRDGVLDAMLLKKSDR